MFPEQAILASLSKKFLGIATLMCAIVRHRTHRYTLFMAGVHNHWSSDVRTGSLIEKDLCMQRLLVKTRCFFRYICLNLCSENLTMCLES